MQTFKEAVFMVLIVAKCNVNKSLADAIMAKFTVLIVAKCNVNINSVISVFINEKGINSSKV